MSVQPVTAQGPSAGDQARSSGPASLTPSRRDALVRWALDGVRIEPWALGLVGFAAYYGGVAVIALASGTFLTDDARSRALALPIIGRMIAMLPHQRLALPVAADVTHHVFSLLLPMLGAVTAVHLLRAPGPALERVRQDAVLAADDTEWDSLVRGIQRRYDAWWIMPVCAAVAIAFLATFVAMCYEPSLTGWWGHRTRGLAGHYLAIVIAGCGYYGFFGLLMLLQTMRGIETAAGHRVILRPYHPDGCNGMRPIGDLILLSYACMVVGGAALFATYYLGYFGLSRSLVMWLCIVAYLGAVPAVVLGPARAVYRAVESAKRQELDRLHGEMHACFETLRNPDMAGPDAAQEAASRLALLSQARDAVRGVSSWPFDTAALRGLIGTYVFQVALVITQAIWK